MRFLRRLLGWTLGIAAALLVIVGGITFLWMRGSLPDTSGTIVVAGLRAPAEIARDGSGLVHIRAEHTDDAYFALGYAHAQDRLWQMEAMRRLGAGRLAEVAGPRLLAQDRLMRALGLYARAEASLPLLGTEARNALAAYARGVNTWMAGHAGALPPEFALLGLTPDPWRPADSLVWGRIMAFSLSGSWRREIGWARVEAQVGAEAAARLFLPYPEDAPVTIPMPSSAAAAPPRGAADAGAGAVAALAAALDRALPEAPPSHVASNSWVIAGARTASGKPLLANDPHLGFRTPNVWYLARIETPELTVAGATAPGVPFHVLGHNGRIAWGMTTTGADTDDLVIETIDPTDPRHYLAPEGPRPFLVRDEVIHVRGAPDVKLTLRETRNGPVLSDIADDLANEAPEGAVIALRSAMLEPDDRSGEALYRINRAEDWAAFTEALRLFASPVQNLIYADVDGHIGLSVAGRVPMRGAGGGDRPARGDNASHDWLGYIEADALPRVLDPDAGTIANANNRVVGPRYPHRIADDWDEPFRAQRLEAALGRIERHDTAASRALQLDTVSLAARELVPLLVGATPRGDENAEVLDLLARWDGVVARDRPEPLILHAWTERIMAALFSDELGPAAATMSRVRPRLIARTLTEDQAWCDDVTTEPVESCADLLANTLEDAQEWLAEAFGGRPGRWRWGDVHQAHFRNLVLDWIPLLGAFTRYSIATDGDDFTLNRGTSRGGEGRAPFSHIHGATLRAIYDLSDLDRTLYSMPGGQSGNPLSAHYSDLTAGWRDGDYMTLPARPTGPLATLRLVPRDSPPGQPLP